jgi:hypothetical protein
MKKLSIFILFYCPLSIESFPQSNYAIFGDDNDVFRGYGCILRFEVRDLDTRILIENANVEIYGVNNQEIANFKTDNRGIGIFFIKDILRHFSYTPDKYLIRFTKSNYRFNEQEIKSEDLKNGGEGLSIILSKGYLVSWSGAPTPTYDELARIVSTKNYDIARHVGYSNGGPPVFEYSVSLGQIRNTGYADNRNENRQTQIEKKDDSQGYHYDVNMANEAAKNRNEVISEQWDGPLISEDGSHYYHKGKQGVCIMKSQGRSDSPVAYRVREIDEDGDLRGDIINAISTHVKVFKDFYGYMWYDFGDAKRVAEEYMRTH